MNSRDRFLAACNLKPVDRPPVWIMRQAGRYLPEYRALKEKYSFVEIVQDPELATIVTLQPLKRFPLDAAILFSDILVIPEALGQPYSFRDGGGIEMAYKIETPDQIDRLDASGIEEKLHYVPKALDRIREKLGSKTALLGFGGSPWTLATYMLEGGSSKNFVTAKEFFHTRPLAFGNLMEKLTRALIKFFKMQIKSGVDAIQIFDSWAVACPAHAYEEMSLRWIREIIDHLPKEFPIILFAKGMTHRCDQLAATGANVLAVDWTRKLSDVAADLKGKAIALQGNLDPVVLSTNPAIVKKETQIILDDMRGKNGHIFNLGHGILPSARLENVATLIETVQRFQS